MGAEVWPRVGVWPGVEAVAVWTLTVGSVMDVGMGATAEGAGVEGSARSENRVSVHLYNVCALKNRVTQRTPTGMISKLTTANAITSQLSNQAALHATSITSLPFLSHSPALDALAMESMPASYNLCQHRCTMQVV